MTPPLTPARIEELESIERVATEAPWSDTTGYNNGGLPTRFFNIPGHNFGSSVEMLAEDSELITAMRNDLPALLEAARRGLELESAIVFDVRDTYTRRSIGMSDEAVLAKWMAGVKERGWTPPGESK